jgi:hypothetical protein
VAWCSPDCGLIVAGKRTITLKRSERAVERKETKKARERIKTRSEWLKEAQTAVNAYVRERDKELPCVSCDKPNDGSHQRHASHYRSVKKCSSLRFDPRNIYSSCAQCNTYLSGNLIEYRIRLVKRKGLAEVEWIESQNGIVRYTIDDLRTIRDDYRARLKAMRDKA